MKTEKGDGNYRALLTETAGDCQLTRFEATRRPSPPKIGLGIKMHLISGKHDYAWGYSRWLPVVCKETAHFQSFTWTQLYFTYSQFYTSIFAHISYTQIEEHSSPVLELPEEDLSLSQLVEARRRFLSLSHSGQAQV
jgi:hypothetical protein